MIQCKKCDVNIPKARSEMGYDVCVNCSTEQKKVGHVIYPHKTGGYIQVVSKEQSENLNRLDRRGTGGVKSAKYYKPFCCRGERKPKQFRNKQCTKTYTSYDEAYDMVSDYYEEWGYEPTLKYLRQLNSSGKIPLMTRIKIQDIITDRYLEPTPRALFRKFNKV